MMKFLPGCLILICFQGFAKPPVDSLSLIRRNQTALATYLISPDSAIVLAEGVLSDARRLRLPYIEAQCHYILSKANWAKANFRLSIEYGYKALQFFENTPYTSWWHQSLLCIARTFIDMKKTTEAQRLIFVSIGLADIHHNDQLYIETWREYSLLLIERGLYDSAIRVADRGLEVSEKIEDSRSVGILFSRKARAYFLMKEYTKSNFFNTLSIRSDRGQNNNRLLCINFYQSAENYFRISKFDSALIELQKSDSLAEYINNFPRQILCHEMMATIFEKQNKTSKTIFELRMVATMKDSLQRQEEKRVVAEARALADLENRDKEIALMVIENKMALQKVTIHRWITGFQTAGIVLMAVIVILLLRMRRNQKRVNKLLEDKNTSIEVQREEISAQAENLQHLNQLKVKLFSVISHDLRGPIANLQVLLDMLTKNVMTPEEFLALSGKLKVDVNINQRTLENLLAWSMSQMEGIKTDPRPLKIGTMIQEVVNLMNDMAGRKNIKIETVPTGIEVVADFNQVQLILRNIVHNAIKFSLNNGKIQIKAEKLDSFCVVSVIDHGVGLTQEEIEILSSSQAFYTKTGTQKEKGTGLGWLLCKEFIQRNGGSFSMRSTPGIETEISFTLPLSLA